MRPRSLLLLLLVHATLCRAQPALDTLNTLFAGSITFRIDRHERLVMDHFVEGRRTEQTTVPLSALDETPPRADSTTMQLRLHCSEAAGRCISRESFKHALITRSGTMALAVSQTNLQRVLQALMALPQERRSLTFAPVAKP